MRDPFPNPTEIEQIHVQNLHDFCEIPHQRDLTVSFLEHWLFSYNSPFHLHIYASAGNEQCSTTRLRCLTNRLTIHGSSLGVQPNQMGHDKQHALRWRPLFPHGIAVQTRWKTSMKQPAQHVNILRQGHPIQSTQTRSARRFIGKW
jgi:hypothetical protein